MPKKNLSSSRYLALEDQASLPALLANLSLLGSAAVGEEEEQEEEPEEEEEEKEANAEVVEALACSACQVRFESVEEQRQHSKLDLHRYNLKQGLRGRWVSVVNHLYKAIHFVDRTFETLRRN